MDGQYQLYKDIEARTNGEIYIGVVGPVRTGKSTFIKHFMELLVLPYMDELHSKERAIDELPQSAGGKMIMTTEPKFIPKEAAKVSMGEGLGMQIRLIDCVGYMVDGASGHMDGEKERMVRTPWFDYEIPFSKAAEIGTKKVIVDHATIGIVVSTDGSIGEIDREDYVQAEKRTVDELQSIGKPFVVVLNTTHPNDPETKKMAEELADKYKTIVVPINCERMQKEDVDSLMTNLLSVFPITQISFYFPKWVNMLNREHPVKTTIISNMQKILKDMGKMQDANQNGIQTDDEYVKQIYIQEKNMENGHVAIRIELKDEYYYRAISELTGMEISDERKLVKMLQDVAHKKMEYDKIWVASEEVRQKGYGVMTPVIDEITIEEPEIIHHGNKYGVKIRAIAPSVHLIKANIETEIAPIVGSEEQAKDLISYISQNGKENAEGIWNTNIFGKSIGQLIEDGIESKVSKLTDESQMKLQDTIQKVVNDSNGGLVCIII